MDSSRLLDPEEIAVRAGREPAFLRLPVPATVFGERAMRMRQLAAANAMGDYLRFAADLAQAQHEAAQAFASTIDRAVPAASVFERAAREGVPPLRFEDGSRDGTWLAILRALLAALAPRLSGSATTVAASLAARGDDVLEALAARVLHGVPEPADLPFVPFVAAALQVHATLLVDGCARVHAALPARAFGRIDDPRACPCCGGPPVASVLHIGPDVGGQRYLECAFCAAQWHLVRIQCAGCGNTQGLDYRHLQPASLTDDEAGRQAAVVRAECCPRCGGYLKLVARDQDPNAEAVADDVATIALDLMLGDAGMQRLGVNFLLMSGPVPTGGSTDGGHDERGDGDDPAPRAFA